MFSKKKKSRIQISAPSNFEHRVHTDFDEQEQKFVGLPRQWQSLIEDTAKRPKPFIDATVITTVEPRKVSMIVWSRSLVSYVHFGELQQYFIVFCYFFFIYSLIYEHLPCSLQSPHSKGIEMMITSI